MKSRLFFLNLFYFKYAKFRREKLNPKYYHFYQHPLHYYFWCLMQKTGSYVLCNGPLLVSFFKSSNLKMALRLSYQTLFNVIYIEEGILETKTDCSAMCGTGYRKRTLQILRVTHFYDLVM